MGIKNLSAVFKKYCKDSICSKNISEYRNKKIAIDLSIYLHRYYATQGNILTGLYYQIKTLLQYNILPVYVIDGKAKSDKDLTIKKRKESKEKIKKKYDELCDSNKESFILHNRMYQIKASDIEFCKNLFDGFGIPYIQAENEADNVCVHLAKSGQVDACMSEDLDLLAQGCPLLLRDFKNKKVKEYCLDKILNNLDLEFLQFQDMCIMCGTDYLENIPKIGSLTSYKLIKKYYNIENVIENIKGNYIIPTNYDYKKIRKIFNSNFKLVYNLKKKNIDLLLIEKIISDNIFNLSTITINKILLEVKIPKEKKITSFF